MSTAAEEFFGFVDEDTSEVYESFEDQEVNEDHVLGLVLGGYISNYETIEDVEAFLDGIKEGLASNDTDSSQFAPNETDFALENGSNE